MNTLLKTIAGKFENPNLRFLLILLITLAITVQNYNVKPSPNGLPDQELTLYSNFLIFKNSFLHLWHHQDLYKLYPAERVDFFKYSPSFALLMAPLAILPDFVGLFLWNFINIFVLCFAFWQLPVKPELKKLLAFLLLVLEAITAMENSQSNSLMAGLIILAFLCLEKNKVALATLLLVSTVFIKIFGLVAFVLLLLYPDKLKAVCYSALWFLAFALLPLLLVTPSELIFIYKSWWLLLSSDYNGSEGLSVMGWLSAWFGINNCKQLIVAVGLIIFCLPLLRYKQFPSQKFRTLFLASILIWVIIFNHKAESPTFVIAVSGLLIWFFIQKGSLINMLLLVLAVVFTILSPMDIFPAHIRNDVFQPYAVKVVPCILIWLKLSYDLISADHPEATTVIPIGK